MNSGGFFKKYGELIVWLLICAITLARAFSGSKYSKVLNLKTLGELIDRSVNTICNKDIEDIGRFDVLSLLIYVRRELLYLADFLKGL